MNVVAKTTSALLQAAAALAVALLGGALAAVAGGLVLGWLMAALAYRISPTIAGYIDDDLSEALLLWCAAIGVVAHTTWMCWRFWSHRVAAWFCGTMSGILGYGALYEMLRSDAANNALTPSEKAICGYGLLFVLSLILGMWSVVTMRRLVRRTPRKGKPAC